MNVVSFVDVRRIDIIFYLTYTTQEWYQYYGVITTIDNVTVIERSYYDTFIIDNNLLEGTNNMHDGTV